MHICISLWCASNTVVSGATAISSSGDIASKKGNITGKAGPFHFLCVGTSGTTTTLIVVGANMGRDSI